MPWKIFYNYNSNMKIEIWLVLLFPILSSIFLQFFLLSAPSVYFSAFLQLSRSDHPIVLNIFKENPKEKLLSHDDLVSSAWPSGSAYTANIYREFQPVTGNVCTFTDKFLFNRETLWYLQRKMQTHDLVAIKNSSW